METTIRTTATTVVEYNESGIVSAKSGYEYQPLLAKAMNAVFSKAWNQFAMHVGDDHVVAEDVMASIVPITEGVYGKAPLGGFTENRFIVIRNDDIGSPYYGMYTVGYILGHAPDGYYVATEESVWIAQWESDEGVMVSDDGKSDPVDVHFSRKGWWPELESVRIYALSDSMQLFELGNRPSHRDSWKPLSQRFPQYSFTE